jgi:hypothetical protein
MPVPVTRVIMEIRIRICLTDRERGLPADHYVTEGLAERKTPPGLEIIIIGTNGE